MAMPRTQPLPGEWTVEEMWQLPEDGNRYEVIGGVLYMTPSPSDEHQDAAGFLAHAIRDYLTRHPVGWMRTAPADVRFGLDIGVQPDVYVAPLIEGRRPRGWRQITHLMLAIEVLSPGTASRDRTIKRDLYQLHADEYWIVDLDARAIERWRPGDERPEVLTEAITWRPQGAGEALSINVPEFFRDVLDS